MEEYNLFDGVNPCDRVEVHSIFIKDFAVCIKPAWDFSDVINILHCSLGSLRRR